MPLGILDIRKKNYGSTEQSHTVDIDQVLMYVTSSSFVLSTGSFLCSPDLISAAELVYLYAYSFLLFLPCLIAAIL